MTTPVELDDFQHELGGVLIGTGTDVQVRAIEGLGQPPVRTSDVEPPSEDGLWLGRVVPVHFAPHGNGISNLVTGSATAGAATASIARVAITPRTARRTRIRPAFRP